MRDLIAKLNAGVEGTTKSPKPASSSKAASLCPKAEPKRFISTSLRILAPNTPIVILIRHDDTPIKVRPKKEHSTVPKDWHTTKLKEESLL